MQSAIQAFEFMKVGHSQLHHQRLIIGISNLYFPS